MQQSDKTDEKRRKYFERDARIRALAAKRHAEQPAAARGGALATEAEIFQALLHETGFATVELPQKLSAEHLLRALVDEIEDVPVCEMARLEQKLGAEMHAQLRDYFARAHALLRARVGEALDEAVAKTEDAVATRASDAAYAPYTTGAKLAEAIGVAERVRDRFYFRRAGGLLPPRPALGQDARAEPPAAFLRKLVTAQALLRRVRDQRSRLLKLLSYFSGGSLAYLALEAAMTVLQEAIGTLQGAYTSEVAADALLPEPEWRAAVRRDLFAMMLLFLAQWCVLPPAPAARRAPENMPERRRFLPLPQVVGGHGGDEKSRRGVHRGVWRQFGHDAGAFDANSGVSCDLADGDRQTLRESHAALARSR